MTGHWLNWRKILISIGIVLGVIALAIWWQIRTDLAVAQARVALGSTMVETPCGPIEYADAGTGVPLLAIHGSGGGYDQGMAFATPLVTRRIRVIAMSRFGYLRTPMSADATAQSQADAFVCLMDVLNIRPATVMGGSAGALSAVHMAIRHPDRVSALILLVPLAYKPPTEAKSAAPMAPWVENLMMTAIGSDFLFWPGLRVARGQLVGTVLATPPALLDAASPTELARINAMMDNILPVSARAAGLRHDTAASKSLTPARLDLLQAPTLIISARDDRYGTYASAEYVASQIAGAAFLGFEAGGHTWVGHDDAVMGAIVDLILPTTQRTSP